MGMVRSHDGLLSRLCSVLVYSSGTVSCHAIRLTLETLRGYLEARRVGTPERGEIAQWQMDWQNIASGLEECD